jgi:hypothetical protein
MLDNRSLNDNDLAQLGRQFFTSAYLMANYNDDTFTLWSANPTIAEDLRIVYDKDAASCVAPSSTPIPTAPIPTSSTAASPDDGGLSGGAIAGIAIAGIVGVALAGLAVWLLFFRRRRQRVTQHDEVLALHSDPPKEQQGPHELQPPQEMPANSMMPYELPT